MDKGELVPDSVVIGLVKERIAQDDCKKGYILDGFPRNTARADVLDKVLAEMGAPLDTALSVDVEKDVLMKRLTGRRTCKNCQQMSDVLRCTMYIFLHQRKREYVINVVASSFREMTIKKKQSEKGLMYMMPRQHPLWTITKKGGY